MTDSEFLLAAEAVLDAIDTAAEAILASSNHDIDCRRAGNVLTITFENDSKMIVNLQPALHEIWVATKSGGYHFKFIASSWHNTRTNEELFDSIKHFGIEQGQVEFLFS